MTVTATVQVQLSLTFSIGKVRVNASGLHGPGPSFACLRVIPFRWRRRRSAVGPHAIACHHCGPSEPEIKSAVNSFTGAFSIE